MEEFMRIIGNGVVKNWQMVAVGVGGCTAIQAISSVIAPSLFPDKPIPAGTDEKAARKQRRSERAQRHEFGVRVVAFTHAAIASYLCLRALFAAPQSIIDNLYARSAESEFIFSLSTGYFIWDVIACIVGNEGIGFIAHGLACTFVYSAALFPFLHYWGLFFLLYELSTPFLHLRWLALQFGVHKSMPGLFFVVQYSFVLAFVAVRLVAGSYSSYYWWGEMIALYNGTYHAVGSTVLVSAHSTLVVCVYLIANIILNGLNWFWFSQMIAAKSGKPNAVSKDAVAPAQTGAETATATTATATSPLSPTSAKKRAPKAE